VITRVASAILVVDDQDVMLRFFVDRLGFTLVTDAEMWPGARWVEVRPPGAETGLVLSAAKDFERDADRQYPMTFACADLEATALALRAAGVEVTDPVREAWGAYVRINDPEGRTLLVNDRD